MTIEQASTLIGNQPKLAVANMYRALGLHVWLNTDADNERRHAAWLVLKHWHNHCAIQAELRNARAARFAPIWN